MGGETSGIKKQAILFEGPDISDMEAKNKDNKEFGISSIEIFGKAEDKYPHNNFVVYEKWNSCGGDSVRELHFYNTPSLWEYLSFQIEAIKRSNIK